MASNDAEPVGGHGPWDAAVAVDARLEAMLGATSGPLNWRAVTARDAREQWMAVREWVEWFRVEFGYDHRVVPPCWYRHPALVSLLSALRDHWLFAYDPMNSALAASDWHRALIVLEQRLRDWAARTGCTAGAHRPDLLADYPDDSTEWEEHLSADIAARRARDEDRRPTEVRRPDDDRA